ncbi:hypothetical protein HOLDEFILI_02917 [Holdemania filiformis DSM 12042]|uniref:Uncharacterized protein n=1 Tax=Holdemania filiformis DSM 12042 TaxID=545696 RepID=B9YAR0_9FIRM|nr:hypothetical protein HOLDEFILI_02917 [Holdemania filiformis DSM 12042]
MNSNDFNYSIKLSQKKRKNPARLHEGRSPFFLFLFFLIYS